MTEVRRHTRKTASGKQVTVRQHHRDTGGAADTRSAGGSGGPQSLAARAEASPPHVSSYWSEGPGTAGGDFWDDDGTSRGGADSMLTIGPEAWEADPDDPGNWEWMSAGAAMQERRDSTRAGKGSWANVADGNDRVGIQVGRVAGRRVEH